ncbi:hypothetical protein [Reichenbachiella ulvae]|uniref:Lipocalin-like domain-containing protein n=1 Tax=Reichenbachiella ulvae TaxID=2980104 RepID=A0ABT3CQM3_9BACT|nr:hypothetical protein [Reichenbachiella ulvae]MCV9385770.1 hypothetical protein [Reichenbachiella ulvae]
MEILRNRYSLILPLVGLLWSCSDPLPETDAPYLEGEWIIEEVDISLDIPTYVSGIDTDEEVFELDIPEEVQTIDILYSRELGFIANEVDYTDEIDFVDSYSLTFNSSGLYRLESKEEFFGLNLLEFLFQYAGADMIMEYFPGENYEYDYGNGEYEIYEEDYSFFIEISYFYSNFGEGIPEGIWEMANGSEDLLFDFKDPLYGEGLNLWQIEWIDDETILLSKSNEAATLSFDYYEKSDYFLDGFGDEYEYEAEASGEMFINSASILLKLKQ